MGRDPDCKGKTPPQTLSTQLPPAIDTQPVSPSESEYPDAPWLRSRSPGIARQSNATSSFGNPAAQWRADSDTITLSVLVRFTWGDEAYGEARVSHRGCLLRAVVVTVGLWPGAVLAGGSGDNALLIIDPSNADSLYVGNHYKSARRIPDRNVIYMEPNASDYQAFVDFQLDALHGTLANRGIADHIDYIIIPPGPHYSMPASGYIENFCVNVNNFALASAYTMAFISDDVLGGDTETRRNEYYLGASTARAFDSSVAWRSGVPSGDQAARRYFIGAMLGYSGPRGNTVAETIAMIDRSVQVDGTRPAGTFYYLHTTDGARSGPRHNSFPSAISALTSLGAAGEEIFDVLPAGKHDCLGIMTGWASPGIIEADMTVTPGAFCDHLTSFAGHFGTSSQTKMSEWIAKGASGSVGAVEEPCNFGGKFPSPRLHVYYYSGSSLGEAALRSLSFVPYQMLLYGDPLTRPFAYIPAVDVSDAPQGFVSGMVTLSPTATTDLPGGSIDHFDLHVDGVLHSNAGVGESFQVDTTRIADGRHDIHVIAYDDSLVASQGRWIGALWVDNLGLGATLAVTPTGGNLSTPFSFDVSAAGRTVVEIRLMHNGRVLAATQNDVATFTVFGRRLGAGSVDVTAVAEFDDGSRAVSDTVTIPIAFAAAAGEFSPGNTPPVAYSYTVDVPVNEPLLLDLPALDIDDDDLTLTVLSSPTQATIESGGGAFLLRPSANAACVDTLTFQADDGISLSNVGVVTIRYAAPSDQPPVPIIAADVGPMVCAGETVLLDAGPFVSYLWSTGDTTRTILADTTGTYTVTVTDDNGCTAADAFEVHVGEQGIVLNFELEAVGDVVNREVTVVLGDCTGSLETRSSFVRVGGGLGTAAFINTAAAAEWAIVGEGHTLDRRVPVSYNACGIAVVDATGANRLVAGDLQTATEASDNFVDITDFSILAAAWGQPIDPNVSFGADVNGDGVQDTADFTAILVNYFTPGDEFFGCADARPTESRELDGRRWIARAKRRIAVSRLRFPGAARADLNADGYVDVLDILTFAVRHKIRLSPRLRQKLRPTRP